MINIRTTNGFGKLADALLQSKAQTIVGSMTNNASFPTPDPALADVQTAINAFEAAIVKAADGGKTEGIIKNQKKAELIDLLHQLGKYVTFTAGENEAVATSSGFSVLKPRTPSAPLQKPGNLVLQEGPNAGELQLTFNRVVGARTYMYQYTLDPLTQDSNWTGLPGTSRKFLFTNLESGKRCWVRVIAYGINNQAVISDPVSKLVQ